MSLYEYRVIAVPGEQLLTRLQSIIDSSGYTGVITWGTNHMGLRTLVVASMTNVIAEAQEHLEGLEHCTWYIGATQDVYQALR